MARNRTLVRLDLGYNNIGAEGAHALVAVLDTNRTLQYIYYLSDMDIDEDTYNLGVDRLELNKILAEKSEMWINKSRLQVHDLANQTNIPKYIAAQIVFWANDNELLYSTTWKSPNGRQFASRFLQMLFVNQIQ